MNITVIGAGAVGGYFGARLHDAGANVTFLVRDKRCRQLEEHGLMVHSVNGDTFLQRPALETDAAKLYNSELVILAVKGYHIDGVMPQLEKLVEKGAKILPLLNGMEHYDLLERTFGRETVIGGLCFIISTLNEKGQIVQTSSHHDLVFGPLHDGQDELCGKLKAYLQKANVHYTYTKDILKEIWNKYVFITAYSGVTTASRMEIGAIREQAETLALYNETVAEMAQLARAYGVDLGEPLIQAMVDRVFQLPEQATSSMHQDFRKRLPLEVESLQGGALRLADAKGLKLPVVQTLYRLLKPYENSKN